MSERILYLFPDTNVFRNDNALEKLWGDGKVRVFISHISDHKVLPSQASEIQKSLGKSWVRNSGFCSTAVKEDIEPIREWELEIERALFSMDILLALLTDGFSESKWTDQEVGFAVGTKVPILPVRLGKDPYGFMGKFQAIPREWGGLLAKSLNRSSSTSSPMRNLRVLPSIPS